VKKTTSNKQAESNLDFTNKNCVYLEENLYSTTVTMLTADFSLSIYYLRSLESATISFIARDASLSLSLD